MAIEDDKIRGKWRQAFLLDNPAARVHLGWLRRPCCPAIWRQGSELAHYDQGPALLSRSLFRWRCFGCSFLPLLPRTLRQSRGVWLHWDDAPRRTAMGRGLIRR